MHRLKIGDIAAYGPEEMLNRQWPKQAILSSSTLAVPANAPANEVGAIADYCNSERVVVLDEQGFVRGVVFPQHFIKQFNQRYQSNRYHLFDVLKQLEEDIPSGSDQRKWFGEMGWTTSWVCDAGGEDKTGPWCPTHNSPCTPVT